MQVLAARFIAFASRSPWTISARPRRQGQVVIGASLHETNQFSGLEQAGSPLVKQLSKYDGGRSTHSTGGAGIVGGWSLSLS
ncbi:hypothetical protein [Sorangium sp. So ce1151]|uniref:hypothetical protein n=1 Tax=Sorangium sp. So ce1151 TaxID=3133332 RepID=UPI003F5EE369